MKSATRVLLSLVSVTAALALTGVVPAMAGAATARTQLSGSQATSSARSVLQGAVPATSAVSFDVSLPLRNSAAAQATMRAVSDPTSAKYRHYLTDSQWESLYAPAPSSVSAAESWLESQGFTVGKVPADRLVVPVTGTAAQVEQAFSTTLNLYKVNGQTVRLAATPLSIPTALSSVISGVVGVNEYLETAPLDNGASTPAKSTTANAQPGQEPAPPAGYRNPQPCSSYWGQKTDTADATSLYKPFVGPLPYDICGYKPGQLRSAYNLAGGVARGDDGAGVTIAIVDAYDSPTLLSDAQEYSKLNDSGHPLAGSQFTNIEPTKVDDETECGAGGWYDEQSLDVESSHAMAPGANIEFVGGENCTDAGLLAAFQTAITTGASVVSDSWLDAEGDLLEDAASKTSFDDAFLMADTTGVSVLFSSGDQGDNYADFGLTAPDYPATSPYVTAVGGTTLEVGPFGFRRAEYGWSTGSQLLCSMSATTSCGSATKPAGVLGFDAGGGGGTSYTYTEPYYQVPVVPSALTLRNQALFGPTPLRVIPDVSMDADAQSGMLIGLTQTFPNGVYYDQFKEGGTSLASPLLAGVVADADQAAGSPIGFLNPALYAADEKTPLAFDDIVAPANPLTAAVTRVNDDDTVDAATGYDVFLRTFDYEGPETYCDGTGDCGTQGVALTTAKGFDSMTGLGSVGPAFVGDLSR